MVSGFKGSKAYFLSLCFFSIFLIMTPLFAATLPSTIDLNNGDEDVLIYGGATDDILGYGSWAAESIIVADVNADGINDMIMGAYGADGPGDARSTSGEVYVYYGSPALAAVNDISGAEGPAPDVVIYGPAPSHMIGGFGSIQKGDVNGDGIYDILLGNYNGDGPTGTRWDCGEAYVIYGSATLPATIDLGAGGQDVTIYGASNSDYLTQFDGIQAQDVNGDGIDDLLLGAYGADGPGNSRGWAGEVYIIYGSDTLPAVIDLAGSAQDVIIYGATADDRLTSLGSRNTGDINGDGIKDILLGAHNADGPGEARSTAGEAYVIYGSAALPAVIDLATSGEDVTIYGAAANNYLTENGNLMADDINGDGVDDLILGAYGGSGPGDSRAYAGEVYLVYGSDTLPAVIDLALNAEDVIIYGASAGDIMSGSGGPVTGDVNGDGISDLLLGSQTACGPGEIRCQSGEAYLIFGSDSLPAILDLAASAEDVTIYGSTYQGYMAHWGALQLGDVNGDGLDDILLGADYNDGPGGSRSQAGEAYVVYGSASMPATINMALGEEDVIIYGATPSDELTRAGGLNSGDVNGDGIEDILLTTTLADGPGDARSQCGEAYVIFGQGDALSATVKDMDHSGKPLAKDYGTARAVIAYATGDNASTTTVACTRSYSGVNLANLSLVADVNWAVTSDRNNFSADVTFHYLDSEIAGLNEGNLVLYKAPAIDGVYEEVAGAAFDTDTNRVTATGITGFSVFVISEPQAAPTPCFIGAAKKSFPKLQLKF